MKTLRTKKALWLLLLLGLLTTTACTCSILSNLPSIISQGEEFLEELPLDSGDGLPQPTQPQDDQPMLASATPRQGTSGGQSLSDLVEAGRIELEMIEASEENTIGPVLTVQIRNPSDEDIVVVIPCGLIFAPENRSEQRLMTIQESRRVLGPGEVATLSPYVACIDGDRGIPSLGAAYSLGTMAEDQLLKLAQCLCNEPLAGQADPSEQISLQFAVWLTAGGQDMEDFITDMESSEGAMGDVLGEQFGEEMAELMDLVMAMMLEPAKVYLDKCDIELTPAP